MKIGICIPTHMGVDNYGALVSIAPKAEEVGFDSVWVSEHLFNMGYIGARIGGRPYYEAMTVLTHVAAMTSRIRLGTSVLVLPYHNPVRLAKVAATLDVISRGRVVLGLGVGRMDDEYKALGVSFHERGAIANEAIDVMRTLWTQDDPEFSGQYYSFSKVKFAPKPVQKPHIPLWIGGVSPAAQRRAGRRGDAWHPSAISPNQVRKGLENVRAVAQKAGKDPSKLPATLLIAWDPEETASLGAQGDDVSLKGSFKDVRRRLQEYQGAGVEAVAVNIASEDPFYVIRHMEPFAQEVLPAFG